MLPLLGLLLLAIAGAGAGSKSGDSGGGSDSGNPGDPGGDSSPTGGQKELDNLLRQAGLSKGWREFCLLTAAGESGFVPNIYLGLPERQPPGTVLSKWWESIGESEYKATIVAFERNAELWENCPWPKDRYTTAGGLFGFLAPNAVYAYRNTSLKCIDPWMIYDAREAIPMFLAYCKRVMGNSRMKTNGDWLDLRLGVGALQRIGVPEQRTDMADKLVKRGTLKRVGLNKSWLYRKVEPLQLDVMALREKLQLP